MVDKQNLADEHKLEYVKPLINQLDVSIQTESNGGIGSDGEEMSTAS